MGKGLEDEPYPVYRFGSLDRLRASIPGVAPEALS
jgi:hypothetical protein